MRPGPTMAHNGITLNQAWFTALKLPSVATVDTYLLTPIVGSVSPVLNVHGVPGL